MHLEAHDGAVALLDEARILFDRRIRASVHRSLNVTIHSSTNFQFQMAEIAQ